VSPLDSQFNNLVQGKSIATITPQQILAAGEPIFLDIKTAADINSINTLIQSYARIHSPTYGQPIPLTGSVVSRNGDAALVTPSDTEVRRVIAVNFENIGLSAITAALTLGGMQIYEVSIPSMKTVVAELSSTIFSTSNFDLAVAALSGDALDLNTSVATVLVVQ
tara:strand:- start:1322 stop:1816 length:495 start_codon:yes stop_codon:yes gene_type:complete